MPLYLGKGRKIGSEPGDLPISSQAASATDRHECPLLIQAQRGPIYQHPPILDRADVARYTANVLEGL